MPKKKRYKSLRQEAPEVDAEVMAESSDRQPEAEEVGISTWWIFNVLVSIHRSVGLPGHIPGHGICGGGDGIASVE